MPEAGTRFGSFELIRRIALGGMAEIFLAKERGIEGIERLLVVKRILAEMTQIDDFVTMFADEARLATRLSHPNIAHVYGFGEIEGVYYLSMEYVEGVTVSQLMRKLRGSPLPLELTLRIIGDVCAGLHYAHELRDDEGALLGVVHRDVSPQNIMVTKNGLAKLIDFGVARASTQVHVTGVSQIKGKLAYMAPEMLKPAKDRFVDRRSDIFATGVVLHEMVAGERLFRRESEAATIMAVRKSEIPSLVDKGAPPVLDVILQKALARDRDDRYSTAQEMQDDIEELIAESPRSATAYSVGKFMRGLLENGSADADASFSFSGSGSGSASPFGSNPSAIEKSDGDETTDVEDKASGLALPKLPLLAQSMEVDISEFQPGSADDEASRDTDAAAVTPPLAEDTAPQDPAPAIPAPPDLSHLGPPAEGSHESAPRRKSRAAMFWWFLAVSVLLGAGVTGGLLALRQGDASARESSGARTEAPKIHPWTPNALPDAGSGRADAGSGQAKTSGAAPPPADAAPPPTHLGDDTARADSGVEDAPEVVASKAPQAPPREPADAATAPPANQAPRSPPGSLFLDTEPWSKVRSGRRNLGTTPVINAKLAAGVHVLRLTGADGKTVRRRILIKSGRPTKVFFRLD